MAGIYQVPLSRLSLLLIARPVEHSRQSFSTASFLGADIFSDSHKQRCSSRLVKPGTPVQTPQWKMPGSKKSVSDIRMAAVLVPLCIVNKQPSILFTLRSAMLSGYQSHVSFPGGMVDAGDRDVSHTAVRETFEEIGIPESKVDLWGQMSMVPGRNFVIAVTPVIGFCGDVDVASLKVNNSEVQEVFAASLASLCDSKNIGYTKFRGDYVSYKLPLFGGQTHRIWGLTAIILHEVLKIIVPDVYRFTYTMYDTVSVKS